MIRNVLIIAAVFVLFAASAAAHDTPLCESPVVIGKVENLNFPGRFVVVGDYVYLLNRSGSELITIDLRDAPSYQRSNTLDLSGQAQEWIIAHQNALYLTQPGHAIRVVDITDPANPTLGPVMTTSSLVRRPVIRGQLMYAGTTDIFDISDPINPTHAGTMSLTHDIAYADDSIAYTRRIEFVDLSDPLNPVTTTPPIGGDIYFTHLEIDHGLSRMYAWTDSSLELFDISTPQQPVLQYQETLYLSTPLEYPSSIGTTWVTAGGSGSDLGFIDLSSEDRPIYLDLSVDLDRESFDHPQHVYLKDGVFYIVSFTYFAAFEISTSPFINSKPTEGFIADIHKSGDLVFTASEEFGVEIFDASDPQQIRKIAEFNQIDSAYSIDSKANTLYIAADREDLVLLDITDPHSPTHISTIETGRRARDVRVVGDLLFVIDRTNGLSIFDVSQPVSPTLRSNIDLPGWNDQISFNHDFTLACVSSQTFDALILDISDPDNPIVVSTITPIDTLNDGIKTSTFDGNLLYTPEFINGYRVWDISDPTSPQLIAHNNIAYPSADGLNTLGSIAYEITLLGDKVLIANGNNGLAQYDNSNPSAPQFERYFQTQPFNTNAVSSARRVYMDANLAYTAVYGGGIRVFQVDDCEPCFADFNLDAQLNFFDVSSFLIEYQDGTPLADLNNDGVLNFFDVSRFLTDFTNACR
ncbi:MAG: hypothetical protein KDA29_14440 [Phycisphaerales bacterium]|nr:hypothetical protein [Phycisphaerales bacterium]